MVSFKFLNKKAVLITAKNIMHIGMFGFAILVFIWMMSYVNSIKEDTKFYKTFLSRDIALLANTLYSAPGNIEYNYYSGNLDISKFKLELKPDAGDKPAVFVEDKELSKAYPYGKPHDDNERHSILGADWLKFYKTDTKLKIAAQQNTEKIGDGN